MSAASECIHQVRKRLSYYDRACSNIPRHCPNRMTSPSSFSSSSSCLSCSTSSCDGRPVGPGRTARQDYTSLSAWSTGSSWRSTGSASRAEPAASLPWCFAVVAAAQEQEQERERERERAAHTQNTNIVLHCV